MGCDIHSSVEVRRDGAWAYVHEALGRDEHDDPDIFPYRNYGLFGFLAGVRNYSESPVIAEPRGLPDDVSAALSEEHDEWAGMAHSTSWLTLAELLYYDYDQVFWDRRITRGSNGAARADEGEGRHVSLREFLGEWYFARLEQLRRLGEPDEVRIVFWFDN